MFSFLFKKKDEYETMLNFLLSASITNIYRYTEYDRTLYVTGVSVTNGIDELYSDGKYLIPKHRVFREWFKVDNSVPSDDMLLDYIIGLRNRYKNDKSQIVKKLIREVHSLVEDILYE